MARRPLAAIIVADLGFKALVGLTLVEEVTSAVILVAAVVATLAQAALLAVWTRPIARFLASESPGADVVRAASDACWRLPRRAAWLTLGGWVAVFAIGTLATAADAELLAFVPGAAVGGFCLSHLVAMWDSAPARVAIDRAAGALEIDVVRKLVSFRQRVTLYALGITTMAGASMAAVGFAAEAFELSRARHVAGIASTFALVVAFSGIGAVFVGITLTQPLRRLAAAIAEITRAGGTLSMNRVPRSAHDEIGTVIAQTNAMIVRLEQAELDRTRAEAEFAAHFAQLEETFEATMAAVERELEERTRVTAEMEIAARIQTSALPGQPAIAGLEIAGTMIPASKVGGDYYDVLPAPGGGVIAIGDVSGHGVDAGLIMLMLHGITAATVTACPDASARELVVAINRALTANIRTRLGARDFVTFTLLRYASDGTLHHAGQHEDIVVWRAATGTCELVETAGLWLGVKPDIAAETVESSLRLAPGDVVVLYTDGILEARDGTGTQFGIERLVALVDANARDGVADLVAAITAGVRAWCPEPADDYTVLAARQQ